MVVSGQNRSSVFDFVFDRGRRETRLTVYFPGLKSHFNSLLNAWVLIPPTNTNTRVTEHVQ